MNMVAKKGVFDLFDLEGERVNDCKKTSSISNNLAGQNTYF
jgi:hypothetical protein